MYWADLKEVILNYYIIKDAVINTVYLWKKSIFSLIDIEYVHR